VREEEKCDEEEEDAVVGHRAPPCEGESCGSHMKIINK
jgi:hypothetical protein